MNRFNIGDPVWYRGAWGSGLPAAGHVAGMGWKNNRRVYDVKLCGHAGECWGYEDQFSPRPPLKTIDAICQGTTP
jgi:hypothetical protein